MVDYRKLFEAEKKIGGRFELAALLQKRAVQLMRGDHPLVETNLKNWIDIAAEEVLAGKISLIPYQEVAMAAPGRSEEDEEERE